MSDYRGLLVRTYKEDTGTFPRSASTCVWTSPDIIPTGTVVAKDPKADFLGSNFDRDFSSEIYLGRENYIYVRGANKSGKRLQGDMYLYASSSSMLLTPNTWKKINSSRNSEKISFTAEANEKIVCNNDDNAIFCWTPQPISGDEHYCFISRIDTHDYPSINPPDIKNISDFAVFLRSEQSTGYAQRNVRLLDSAVPQYTLRETVKNTFPEPITDGYLIVNCYGLPVGSEIEMTCPKSSKDCYLEIPKTKIPEYRVSPPLVYAAKVVNMPSGFDAPIRVYYRSNGKLSGQDFKIELDFRATFDSNSTAFEYGEPLEELNFDMLFDNGEFITRQNFSDYCKQIEPKKSSVVGRNSYVKK